MDFTKKNILLYGALIPLVILALATPWSESLDLAISRFFFHQTHFISSGHLDRIFFYGLFPAWTLCILALIGWSCSYFFQSWRFLKAPCAVLILTLAIGSGLLIHVVFKEHWGRPRPKQIQEFGGEQVFLPYYQPNFSPIQPSKSFPSGHTSMGFYFFSLIWIGICYGSRRLIWSGLFLSVLCGGILSYGRLAQGGHFFTDILVSALLMWWTALGCSVCLILKRGIKT